MTIRTIWAVAALSPLAAHGAPAADLPLKAPAPPAATAMDWTGFYVGVHGGYGWGDEPVSQFPLSAAASDGFVNGSVVTSLGTDPRGFLGGIQAGYNFRRSSIVYGVEADFSFADMRGTASITTPGNAAFIALNNSAEQKLEWFGTLRGRGGIAFNEHLLAYLTGGLAVGKVSLSDSLTSVAPLTCAVTICPSASTSETKWGWALGAGLEHVVRERWTMKIEYLYYDLGEISHTYVDTRTPIGSLFVFGASANFSGHVARIGLNYKFGAGAKFAELHWGE